jgi:hypothetical protein
MLASVGQACSVMRTGICVRRLMLFLKRTIYAVGSRHSLQAAQRNEVRCWQCHGARRRVHMVVMMLTVVMIIVKTRQC